METGWEIKGSVVEWCYQRALFLGRQQERNRLNVQENILFLDFLSSQHIEDASEMDQPLSQ